MKTLLRIVRRPAWIFVLIALASCGIDTNTNKSKALELQFNAASEDEVVAMAPDDLTPSPQTTDPATFTCPESELGPPEVVKERGPIGPPPLDPDQELKDLGTTMVVKKFFTSPETLFNFLKLVYGNIDNALANYRQLNNLEDRAIFFLFKGGNVLRMVANKTFDLLSPKARDFLKEEYAQYFQRSDADFSVYVDELKLGNLNYDIVFAEVTELLFSELDKIREEFKANPEKYFNFLQLKTSLASSELGVFFEKLKEITATKDDSNENWFKAKFAQLQMLDNRAKPELFCPFQGKYDYRTEIVGNQTVATRVNETPNWIVNTDNRTLESHWGSDPTKTVKFSLVRSKVVFEYVYEKDGKLHRRPIGGELVDVSMPNAKDDRLRPFLDNYDKTVSEYTIASEQLEDKIVVKSYSPSNLAEDLQFILFDSYDRPWNGGAKYAKRVNRYFFLSIAEMLGTNGPGPEQAQSYINDVKTKILEPLSSFYPLNEGSAAIAEQIKSSAAEIKNNWGTMAVTNEFWTALGDFVSGRLTQSPQDEDEKGFQEFLENIGRNLDIASQALQIQTEKIPTEELYQVDIKNIF